MKNIFLIGKFNRITQDFNNCLSGKYHVQLGSDNSDIIRGMLAMNPPDLVIINLMAMEYSHQQSRITGSRRRNFRQTEMGRE